MRVIWSDEAILDYHQNIDYLLTKWSEQVAIDFIEDVEAVIDLIRSYPELYPLTDYQKIRKAVVTKQVTLFFTSTGNELQLIRFWNNYRDPDKLRL
jgi:plasmid stabilization system protein ParE